MTTSDDTPSQTPAWYPDPDDSNSEVYWDGARFHGRRKRDSSALDTRLQRFKRLFSNPKWAWVALVAFLPIMGTIVGGWISAHAGAEQAQRNFTQSQQRDAYAAFYSSVNDFVETVEAEERKYEPFDRAAVERLAAPLKENLGTATDNVSIAESKVTFFGSEQTQQTAEEVVKQVTDIQLKLRTFEHAHPEYPDLNPADGLKFGDVAIDIQGLLYNKLRLAQADFRNAGRRDLGLPAISRDTFNPLYGIPPAAQPAPPSQPPR